MREQFEKIKTTLIQKISMVIIVASFTALGFVMGTIYPKYTKPEQPSLVKTLKSTSVAVNERGEMMLMNREDGSYIMYSDSVGMVVFDLYSNLIIANQ